MSTLRANYLFVKRQRGAALMVMLVILIVGITTFLVSALSSSALQSERNKSTSDALAQAKDALIGNAASDPTLPGSLPCPDNHIIGTNSEGTADSLSGNNCPYYIGRLPWKSLRLPDLRDASGERLWYALSVNFRPQTLTPHSVNSETNGTLNLTGSLTANNVVAIIFAPGTPINTQSRGSVSANCATLNTSVPQTNCAENYLEGTNAALNTAASPNINFQADSSAAFNDQLITITSAQLFPPVEMRVAREAKNCLDGYAILNSYKYPWAADPADTFSFSKLNTLFGRLPKNQTPDSNVQNMIDALNAFQSVVTSCAAGTGSQASLISAGNQLENTADYVKDHQPTTPPITASVTTPAKTAGDLAKDSTVTCSDIQANPTGNSIQTNLNSATSALDAMSASLPWPASCTLFSSAYWHDWKNQVFYQVDTKYSPSGPGSGIPSLTINGTGNYNAIVVVSRSPVTGQAPRNPSNPGTYLEGANLHTNPAPATTFTNNSISSSDYKNVNDLVICLDGNLTCK